MPTSRTTAPRPEQQPAEKSPHAGVMVRPRASRTVFALVVLVSAVVLSSMVVATQAFAISRDDVLARAQAWVDSPVPYSQAKSHLGYRTDCSGYVSMCWKTGTSWSTASFHAVSHRIPTSQLQPGDALLKPGYHIRLFYGWTDASHTQYVAYEANTVVAVCRVHSISDDLSAGYSPARYNRISNSPASSNVLQNGSFNTWARSWSSRDGQPVWWQATGVSWQTLVAHNTVAYRSARNSLTLLNPSADPAIFTELSQSAPVIGGVNYRVSAWARASSDPRGLQLKLVYLNALGQSVAETSTAGNLSGVGGSSFARMSALLATPPDAVKATVTVLLAGGTTTNTAGVVVGTSATLDDVSLVRPRVSASIRASAATSRSGRTVVLSGSVTPTSAIGAPAIVYVQRPGSGWRRLSSSRIFALGTAAVWRTSLTFTRRSRRGTYRFMTTIPAIAGYLGSSTSSVSVKLK